MQLQPFVNFVESRLYNFYEVTSYYHIIVTHDLMRWNLNVNTETK